MEQEWNKIAAAGATLPGRRAIPAKELPRLIDEQNTLYSQMGPIGNSFIRDINALGVEEAIEPDLENLTACYSFAHEDTSLRPQIIYGVHAFVDDLAFFQARTHEFEHALQHAINPALHAIPGNPASDIILSPRDYCLIMELMERAAFTCEKYLSTLFKKAASPEGPFSAAEEAILQTPAVTLPQYASIILEYMPYEENQSALAYYHGKALEIYEQELDKRLNDKDSAGLTVVKLSPHDILSLGRRWGVDLFAKADFIQNYDVQNLKLTADQKMHAAYLDNVLGFGNHENLPTLEEELQERQSTSAEFLAYHLARKSTQPCMT